MADSDSSNSNLTRQIKSGVVSFFSIFSSVALTMGLCKLFLLLSVPASVLLWLAGAVVTHIWLFRGFARPPGEKPSLTDFGAYARDSGIPIIVLGWPISVSVTFLPDIIEPRLEKWLGLEQHEDDEQADRSA